MSREGNFFFATRNQPNYSWWRPLAEILAVAVLAVLFTGVIGLTLEAMGMDTSSGAADKYFGYGSVIVEILAVLVAVRLIGRRPVASVFTGQPGTKAWVPFAAFAAALAVICAVMSLVAVYGYNASWNQVVGNIGADFPYGFAALLLAALAEEMAFRGVVLQAFTAWTRNPVIGALLATIPFVLVHPQAYGSPVGIAHYFADALLFTLLVWAFNGIWVAVAVHLAWNAFGTVQDFGLPTSAPATAAGCVAMAAATAVVVALFRRTVSLGPSLGPAA